MWWRIFGDQYEIFKSYIYINKWIVWHSIFFPSIHLWTTTIFLSPFLHDSNFLNKLIFPFGTSYFIPKALFRISKYHLENSETEYLLLLDFKWKKTRNRSRIRIILNRMFPNVLFFISLQNSRRVRQYFVAGFLRRICESRIFIDALTKIAPEFSLTFLRFISVRR